MAYVRAPEHVSAGSTCLRRHVYRRQEEDMDMYARVLADALKQGKRVAEAVQFYIQFGSQDIRRYAVEKGIWTSFRKPARR